MSELDVLIETADVVVCCGSGGVGKTTTAAALGLQAARNGRRCVVVTIDPAKRLADALGVPGGLTNDPIQLSLAGPGELWALMLDTATTFDGLVIANAANPEQANRILTNSFYRNIAGSLDNTQEYMAAERLLALHRDERFDLVIVDWNMPAMSGTAFLTQVRRDYPDVVRMILSGSMDPRSISRATATSRGRGFSRAASSPPTCWKPGRARPRSRSRACAAASSAPET